VGAAPAPPPPAENLAGAEPATPGPPARLKRGQAGRKAEVRGWGSPSPPPLASPSLRSSPRNRTSCGARPHARSHRNRSKSQASLTLKKKKSILFKKNKMRAHGTPPVPTDLAPQFKIQDISPFPKSHGAPSPAQSTRCSGRSSSSSVSPSATVTTGRVPCGVPHTLRWLPPTKGVWGDYIRADRPPTGETGVEHADGGSRLVPRHLQHQRGSHYGHASAANRGKNRNPSFPKIHRMFVPPAAAARERGMPSGREPAPSAFSNTADRRNARCLVKPPLGRGES